MKKHCWIFLPILFLAACASAPGGTGASPTPAPPMEEAATATAPAAGLLTGYVRIGPLVPVVREGESEPTPSPEVYAAWEVLVLNADGSREIARADIAADGTYQVELPPGSYLVTGRQREGRAFMQQQRYPVTVRAGETTVQDLSLDTGIR